MINKNLFAGLLALFLFGCSPLIPTKVLKHPQVYDFEVGVPLKWDGQYPVEVFNTEFTLGEEVIGTYGYFYTLTKHNKKDSVYILSVRLDKNIYHPPYDRVDVE